MKDKERRLKEVEAVLKQSLVRGRIMPTTEGVCKSLIQDPVFISALQEAKRTIKKMPGKEGLSVVDYHKDPDFKRAVERILKEKDWKRCDCASDCASDCTCQKQSKGMN